MTREDSLDFLNQIINKIENAGSEEIVEMKKLYKKFLNDTEEEESYIELYMAHELSGYDVLCMDSDSIYLDFNSENEEFSYDKKGLFWKNEWQECDNIKTMNKTAAAA